jgi:anti-anti-sigma factor
MSFVTTMQDGAAVIRVPARFDFRRIGDFHGAVDKVFEQRLADEIVIDLSDTEYLDSAALGMLLVLRDRARGERAGVVLASARGTVSNVLSAANFAKLFAFR